MHQIIDSIVQIIQSLWYSWVFLGMLLESTFLPVPSEVIMIPAGYLASQGKMSLWILFFLWTSWAVIWSFINYTLWKYLWWPIVHKLVKKYGKYIFLSEKHYEKSEIFFKNHGSIATFTGRLLPELRHLISIPAGVFHMNKKKFFVYTLFWASIWNIILIALGYIAGENKELIEKYSHETLLGTLVFIGFIIIIYIWKQKKR